MSTYLTVTITPSDILKKIREELETVGGYSVLESYILVKDAFDETWVEESAELDFTVLVDDIIPPHVVHVLEPIHVEIEARVDALIDDSELLDDFDRMESPDIGGNGLEPEY